MKSPNNTTDIPDVNCMKYLDHGLCSSKKKGRKTYVWKEKLRKKNINCHANVGKSEESFRIMI